jgi:hypothetical protein
MQTNQDRGCDCRQILELTMKAAATARSESGRAPALIDAYLPAFDVRDYRATRVAAEPAAAYAAFRSLDLKRSRLVRLLFSIRTLPEWFRERRSVSNPPYASFLDEALAVGWTILEEAPGRELVVGAVTQPWAPVVRFHGLPAAEFVEFAQPGFTRIAWSIAARPAEPGMTELVTETRVAATDPVSRKRFRRYWFFVNPGIRLIRILSLRLIRRDLERRKVESGFSSGRAST